MPQVLGKEYRVFDGNSYRNLMLQLIEAGLTPMNVADVMKARLEAINSGYSEQKDFWLNNYFDTVNGIVYSECKIKIVHDARALKDVKPDTKLSIGALILALEEYENIEGEEFSRKDLEKAGLDTRLTKSGVKSHPVWQALARDKDLLSEYTDVIFAEVKQIYNDNKAMGIYLGSEQSSPTMRAWFVGGLYYGSGARGGRDFSDDARLVGVRAEGAAQNIVKDYTLEEVQRALKELEELKQSVGAERVQSIEDLLRKL